MKIVKKLRFVIAAVILLAIGLASDLYLATGGPADGPHRPRLVNATAFAQRDIVVNGMRLRYVDEGAGRPIILLPGHTSRIEEYDTLIAALRGKYRVLVFDFPGSGYSDKPDREYDLRFYEDTVLGFMDAIGLGRCHLAGGSLGGNLALRLAYRAPERFDRIVAWAPAGAWPEKPVLAALTGGLGGRLTFWPMVKIQSTYWYRDDLPQKDAMLDQTFAYYHEVMSPAFVRMYWGMATDQLKHSLLDLSRGIRRPTLLMSGDRDSGFDIGAGIRRLHDEMPHSELLEFPDTGHSIACERPAQLTEALVEFFGRPEAALP
jgi:pimeloyl-ACP methyl ester carboxylesterase